MEIQAIDTTKLNEDEYKVRNLYLRIDQNISDNAGKGSLEKYGLLLGYTNEKSEKGLLHAAGRVIFYNNMEIALKEATEYIESQRKAKGKFWSGAFNCHKFDKNWKNKQVIIVSLKKNFQRLYGQGITPYNHEIKRFIVERRKEK